MSNNFLKSAKSRHGSRYTYKLIPSGKGKATIVCRIHGEFLQSKSMHLRGQNCPKCAIITRSRKTTRTYLHRKFEGLEQPEAYKLIPLGGGKFAEVDNADFDRVKGINWSLRGNYVWNETKGSLHRFIMNCPKSLEVDHINNQDTLNHRRSNLRLCTKSQNMSNRRSGSNSSSKFKGVVWDKSRGMWKVGITVNNKDHFIGRFKSEEEAAKAYIDKALQLHKEFAYTKQGFSEA